MKAWKDLKDGDRVFGVIEDSAGNIIEHLALKVQVQEKVLFIMISNKAKGFWRHEFPKNAGIVFSREPNKVITVWPDKDQAIEDILKKYEKDCSRA